MDDTERPIILVTNDDGWQASGVVALADALEDVGEVWVVAPERPRSAVSHSISLHKPLRLKQTAERRFWCSGTPADCVYIAVNHLLPRPASFVASGINHGANLGDDVTYSGTVGGAMEGTLMEIPSASFSLVGRSSHAFGPATVLAQRVAREVLERGLPPKTLLNVNIPPGWEPDGPVAVTRLGHRNYGRVVSKNFDPRGKPYYWIGGAELGFHELHGSDCDAVYNGVAAVSPVKLDLTEYELMDALRGWDFAAQGASADGEAGDERADFSSDDTE